MIIMLDLILKLFSRYFKVSVSINEYMTLEQEVLNLCCVHEQNTKFHKVLINIQEASTLS